LRRSAYAPDGVDRRRHPEFRESASALLEAEGLAVIGEAADGDEAITAVERLRP